MSLSSAISTWRYGRKQHSPGWVLERCVPPEPEAEPTDSMEQPGPELNEELDEVETEPNCDTIDPDAWASESEVDNCDAERLVVT